MQKVPFYPNLADDTHCVQAAFKMMLKYFLPDRDFSWAELDKMSAKLPGKATWPAHMLLSLQSLGFDVVLVESFDAQAFIKDGAEYLRHEYGKQAADWQIANSNIPAEQKAYKALLASDVRLDGREPTLLDIKDYLEQGYSVKCTVNAQKLNNQKGYTGHSVVILSIDSQNIVFHDPGLPQHENRVEKTADFEAAWASPNEKAKELIAIKYKEA